MFNMNGDYTNYWTEEDEMKMKVGVHPSQIIERIQKALAEGEIKGEITHMDYDGFLEKK